MFRRRPSQATAPVVPVVIAVSLLEAKQKPTARRDGRLTLSWFHPTSAMFNSMALVVPVIGGYRDWLIAFAFAVLLTGGILRFDPSEASSRWLHISGD